MTGGISRVEAYLLSAFHRQWGLGGFPSLDVDYGGERALVGLSQVLVEK